MYGTLMRRLKTESPSRERYIVVNRRIIHRATSLIITLFLIITVALTIPSLYAASHTTSSNITSSFDLDSIQPGEQIRIIVGLDIPFLPEGQISTLEAQQNQHASIANAQIALLNRLSTLNVQSVKRFETIPYIAMIVDKTALSVLYQDPLVGSITRDQQRKPLLSESTPLIGATRAWADGFSGKGWTVAVLDTGVDSTHPFLKDKVIDEACFSSNNDPELYQGMISVTCPNGTEEQTGSGAGIHCTGDFCDHGTHVAGIVAGNSDEFSGVAKDATILSVQVFSLLHSEDICYKSGLRSPCSVTYDRDVIRGLEYVYQQRDSHQIAAINLSIGGGEYSSVEACDQEEDLLPMKAIVDNLRSAGIPTIAAAGNNGNGDALAAPACLSNVISVGSTRDNDAVSSFSNTAAFLDLFAPGAQITSSVPGGSYKAMDGSSQATPHVAGAWAVLRSYAPTNTTNIDTVLLKLQETGVPIVDKGNQRTLKTIPRIQLDAALEVFDADHVHADAPTNFVALQTTAQTMTFTWDDTSDSETGYQIEQRKPGRSDTAWETIGIVESDQTSYTHTYTDATACGTYTYRVSAFDREAVYAPEQAGIYATSATATPICQPSGVSIRGKTEGYTSANYTVYVDMDPPSDITYTWSPEPASGQGTSRATYSWNTPDEYTVSVSVGNKAGSAIANHTIAIAYPPAPTNVAIEQYRSALSGTNYLYDFEALVTPSDIDELVTYTWSPEPHIGQGTALASYAYTVGAKEILTVEVTVANKAGEVRNTETITISTPTIVIPEQVQVISGTTETSSTLHVPLTYFANGSDLSDAFFYMDYDTSKLSFDPSTGISFAEGITGNVFADKSFADKELYVELIGPSEQLSRSDNALSDNALAALPDGETVATLTFTLPADSPLADAQFVDTGNLVKVKDNPDGGTGLVLSDRVFLPMVVE